MLHVENGVGLSAAWDFLRRRIVRIAPLYWIFTAFTVLIYFRATGGVHFPEFGKILTSFLFLPHADLTPSKWDVPLLDVGWTLNYEMFFYVVFATSLFVRQKLARLLFVSLVLLIVSIVFIYYDMPMPLYFWFNPIICEFSLGMLIAVIFKRFKPISNNILYLLCLISIVIFTLGTYNHHDIVDFLGIFSSVWRPLCWGIPAACLVFCAVATSDIPNKVVSRGFLSLGAASFSIYLAHTFILDALARFITRREHLVPLSPAMLIDLGEISIAVLAVIGGVVVHHLVERPVAKMFAVVR